MSPYSTLNYKRKFEFLMSPREDLTKLQDKGFQEEFIHVLCIDDEKDFVTLISQSLEDLSHGQIKTETSFSAKQGLA